MISLRFFFLRIILDLVGEALEISENFKSLDILEFKFLFLKSLKCLVLVLDFPILLLEVINNDFLLSIFVFISLAGKSQ